MGLHVYKHVRRLQANNVSTVLIGFKYFVEILTVYYVLEIPNVYFVNDMYISTKSLIFI